MTQAEAADIPLELDPSYREVTVPPEAYSPLLTETPAAEKEQAGSGTQGVKTGDDTPVLQYLILGAASGAILISLIFAARRRRRRR
jgi:LPXTG-motif cell wall-anchored protein